MLATAPAPSPIKVNINSSSAVIARSHPYMVIEQDSARGASTLEEAVKLAKTGYRTKCIIDTETDTVWDPTGTQSADASEYYDALRAWSTAQDNNSRVMRLKQARNDYPQFVAVTDEQLAAMVITVPAFPGAVHTVTLK